MKDLTSYWDSFADKDQYPAGTVWKTDGKIYNLLPYTNLLGMYYNKTALAASGITTPPTTLDELQADMAKVTATGKYKAIALSGAPTVEGAWLFAPQLLGLGVDYCNLSGQKVESAFQRIATWHEDGYTPQATATWDQNAAWQQFMTGKYAFAFNGNWQLGSVTDASFPWGTAEFPAPDGGTSKVYPGGEGFAIGANSKHPKLAWEFLSQTIFSQQGQEEVFAKAGSIPLLASAAASKAIAGDASVRPFVEATKDTGAWPDNENTADMQTAFGQAVSGVLSGQLSASQGAAQAESQIRELINQGGGTC
jgi:multiple sugar transport system substrate-binding protein